MIIKYRCLIDGTACIEELTFNNETNRYDDKKSPISAHCRLFPCVVKPTII